jgi:hypothetical protein
LDSDKKLKWVDRQMEFDHHNTGSSMLSEETHILNTFLPLLNPAFTVPRSPHMSELYLQPIGYLTTLLLYILHHSGVILRGFPEERLGAPFPFEQFRTLPDLCLWKDVKIYFFVLMLSTVSLASLTFFKDSPHFYYASSSLLSTFLPGPFGWYPFPLQIGNLFSNFQAPN